MSAKPSIDTAIWDEAGELFARALLPSIVQHPGWLQPMFRELGDGSGRALPVEGRDGDRLVALAALERQKLLHGFPFAVAATWDCGFLFSGLPLLDGEVPETALAQLLEGAAQRFGASAVLLRKVPLEGPFADAAYALFKASKVKLRVYERHQRACLNDQQDYTDWFQESFSRKRRHEYRRHRRRMEEAGELQISEWRSGQSLDSWIEDFLRLESAGWKGARGTAIASDRSHADFFRAAIPELAAAGELMFWRISLDGKPAAMLFAFGRAERGSVCLGKMAYDETLSQYSPGVMVILEASRTLLDKGLRVSVDSAADPNHPLMDNVWKGRLQVGDVLLSTPGTGSLKFSAIAWSERIRRAVRNKAKRYYNLIRRRK